MPPHGEPMARARAVANEKSTRTFLQDLLPLLVYAAIQQPKMTAPLPESGAGAINGGELRAGGPQRKRCHTGGPLPRNSAWQNRGHRGGRSGGSAPTTRHAEEARLPGHGVRGSQPALAAFRSRLPIRAARHRPRRRARRRIRALSRAARAVGGVPIIFLTARDSDFDVISGLRWAADDYLTKDAGAAPPPRAHQSAFRAR